jgi:hypothetical protein
MSWWRRFVGKDEDGEEDEPARVVHEVRELLDPYQERSMVVEDDRSR